MPLFDAATIADRRRRASGALAGVAKTVLVCSGQPIGKPGGLDQAYPFLAHPLYYWLTGSRRSGGVLAWDAAGGWKDFVRPVSADERIWEGEPEAPEGESVSKLSEWLKGRDAVTVGAPLKETPADEAIRERLDAARRPKDAGELALLDRAVKATAAGHAKVRAMIRPGITERELAIEFEAETRRAGADGFGYGTIVGIGTNAAVLHFDPGPRAASPDDVVLIDAGGEVGGYTADVTRTWPASGKFSAEAQAIRDLVLASHGAGIAKCRAGVEWHDVHRAAATTIATGLRDLGVLRGDPANLAESGAVALFFPHGIGHMVGLGVRDVGGRAPGRPEGRMCCGAKVRVDLPVQPGFLMTIEPGIYFIPALLDDPARREKFQDAVNWDVLPKWRKVGGVRIEDNVLVTAGEPRVITAEIPR